MTSLSDINELIQEIIKQSQIVLIFSQKCHIAASVLKEIQNNINQSQASRDWKQEEFLAIKENLTKLLKLVESLGNQEWLQLFLMADPKDKPIQQPVTDINEYINTIVDIINTCEFIKQFKMLSDDLYTDFVTIDELLADPKYQKDDKIQQRRRELEDNFKQMQKPIDEINSTSNEADNFAELSKYSDFCINPPNYSKIELYDDNRLFTSYLGENNITKKKLRIISLKDSSKFKRIFSILVSVHHPYLEKFIGASKIDDTFEIVTFREGSRLRELCSIDDYYINEEEDEDEQVYLYPGDRTLIAFKIAEAMAYLHSRGVIHRSLSTSNIYIKKVTDKDDKEKDEVVPIVANFANSRLLSRSSIIGMTNYASSSFSPLFVAPELSDSPVYDEKVDVFAFSGILFELLCGRPPSIDFPGEVSKLLRAGRRPEIDDKCPENLRTLIEQCWAQKPEERFTFEQVIDYMMSRKVVFPYDEEAREEIERFYEGVIVKSATSRKCISTFEEIKRKIGRTFVYRFEFLRVRPIISHYQYMLRTSRHLEEDDRKSGLEKLHENQKRLLGIILKASQNKWYSIALHNRPDSITYELNNCMDEIHQSMVNLDIEVSEKYVVEKNDIVFDYRQLLDEYLSQIDEINEIECNEKFNEIEKTKKLIFDRINEIDCFLDDKNLKEVESSEVIRLQIKDLFSQFKKFERKKSDFTKGEIIGDGLTSIVNIGIDNKNGEKVAIKRLRKDYLNKGEFPLRSLQREMTSLTRLQHKYIAKFKGFCLSEKSVSVWLIFEYIKGESLYYQKFDLNPLEKTKIAFKIAEGMEYIHSRRILHRDLKTANVLLDGYTPKIMDFGFARSDISFVDKTVGIGTPNYMAPEVFDNDGNYGSEADVFSFAMMLWEIENNSVPFENLNELQIKRKVSRGVKLFFEDDCQEELKKLISMCLNKKPMKRPSFMTIIDKMINQNIMFTGADSGEVKKFYDEKKKERETLNL